MISLIVLLTVIPLLPAQALVRTSSSSPSPIDVKAVLHDCDRLVLARVADVHEFRRARDTFGTPAAPVIRVAELEVVEAPFGSTKERLFVRLPENRTSPSGLLLWPLGRALRLRDADWEDLPRVEEKLAPDPLWMPSISLQGPWPVLDRNGARRVSVPVVLIPSKRLDEKVPPTRATMELDLEPLLTTVRTELQRIEPRIEASIASTGAGCFDVAIDAGKRGQMQCGERKTFEWDDAQRTRWQVAVSLAQFFSLPKEVGASAAPDESVEVLSLVSHEGRRTVLIMGAVTSTPQAREQLDRARTLWKTLRELVPGD